MVTTEQLANGFVLRLEADFGEDYSFRTYLSEQEGQAIEVTGKRKELDSVYAEVIDALWEMGFRRNYYTTGTGRHGAFGWLEDGRIRMTFYTRKEK